MWDASRGRAAKRAAEAQLNRRALSLAAREPTLVYRIVPVEAEAKVRIKVWRANSKRQSDGDLIGTGTVTDFGGVYPRLQQLTSKDTDRIDALPEKIRDELIQWDDVVREHLRTDVESAGDARGPRPRPSLADREPTLSYHIRWSAQHREYLISVYPEPQTSHFPLAIEGVPGVSGQYQPPRGTLTSKDTDLIDALPEKIWETLFDLDNTVRGRLKANTTSPTSPLPSEPGTQRPSLADREPTLLYRIEPREDGRTVRLLAYRHKPVDLLPIASFTVADDGRSHQQREWLTSKDTDLIDALPETVRVALFDFDDAVRATLQITAVEDGSSPRRPSLADRRPTLSYSIWGNGTHEYSISAYPDPPTSSVPLASVAVTGTSGPYQLLHHSLTSKETGLIDALPEAIRDALFDLDDAVRASLQTDTPEGAPQPPPEAGTLWSAERPPGGPGLADREPTLVYRIVPIPAGEKVLAKVYRASPKEHRRRALIGTITITDFGEDYPHFQQFTTKDTDRINELPEAIRKDLLDIDDMVRAHLRDLARQNAKRRLRRRRSKPAG